ncbi:restriction endonuclease [Chryseobacterium sp. GVT01B]|uniref:restriction endonuclease n=1 Tax=Chryseobacterium sp. GVT01B TaxID=2862675 RepID=UPI001CC0A6F7|nr:restriction endonuclease [Chryseobacterium sp. GVT01B]
MDIEENENLRIAINEIIDNQGLNLIELSKKNETSNETEFVVINTITKGIYRSEDSYIGVFLNFVNENSYPEGLKKTLRKKYKIENIYEGEKYALCLSNNNIYTFRIELYKKLFDIINSIDTFISIETQEMLIANEDKNTLSALIIKTNIASFMLSGLLGDDYEEEERVLLSEKLEKSRPFFDFKAPINFEWNKLVGDKDRQFERICELLLQKEKNISRIIPIGKTRASDRGRDFEVYEKVESFGNGEEKKWLVQCKFSENSISPNHISGWTDRVIEHNYYGFWLMTNNDITPSLFDQFKDVEKNEKFNIKTKFWQRSDFYVKLNVHSEIFTKNDIFEL